MPVKRRIPDSSPVDTTTLEPGGDPKVDAVIRATEGRRTRGAEGLAGHEKEPARGTHTRGARTQSARAEGMRTQGTRTQSARAEGMRTQGAHSQDAHSQGARADGMRTPGTRTPGRRTQGTHTEATGAARLVIGRVVGRAPSGAPLVTFPGAPSEEPLPAMTTTAVADRDIGRQAALLFESGDRRRPILVGLIQDYYGGASGAETVTVERDGEKVTLAAGQEIVLRCGKSSITLTADGRIVIRGAHVVSRATGVNRIFGGSVQLN